MKRLLLLSGAGYLTSDMWYEIYKSFYGKLPNFQSKYGAGSYALITGGSDGIGKGFAEVLASRGMNLVLVARNPEKLRQVSEELEKKYKIKAITHSLDLSKARKSDFDELKRKTEALDVSILINNAGNISTKKTSDFSYTEIEEIVSLNCTAVVHLMNMYLPGLKKRVHRSGVINVGSCLGVSPIPYRILYSATKAFDHYMLIGASEEYRDTIDFLSYQPATVYTAGIGYNRNWSTETVETAVNGALKDLGWRRSTHGTIKHTLMGLMYKYLPEAVVLRQFYSYFEEVDKKRQSANKK